LEKTFESFWQEHVNATQRSEEAEDSHIPAPPPSQGRARV